MTKGSGAVIATESVSTDQATGKPMFTNRSSVFIRGEGGWGGERGPSGKAERVPPVDPDHQVTYSTRTDQALLYRLNGDRNPLHSDPQFSALAGFPKLDPARIVHLWLHRAGAPAVIAAATPTPTASCRWRERFSKPVHVFPRRRPHRSRCGRWTTGRRFFPDLDPARRGGGRRRPLHLPG